MSKVLESFVGQWVFDELDGKLDGRQYDALKGRSTTHELVDIFHHWHQALENSCAVRAVFIDYAKAGRSCLVVTHLPAAREDPSSNRAAGKSLCFHENHCDAQLWARAAH